MIFCIKLDYEHSYKLCKKYCIAQNYKYGDDAKLLGYIRQI